MKNKLSEKTGLQIKMTAFVTSAVLLVSAAVLLIVAVRVDRSYEALLQDRLSDGLTAITRIMEQRLLRVEETTETMAGIASLLIEDKQKTDSLLCHSLDAIDDVHGVFMVFDRNFIQCDGGYYERFAHCDVDGINKLDEYINGKELESDPEWRKCYYEGKYFWGKAGRYYPSGNPTISYYVPLRDGKGKRIGMAYSVVLESYLTRFVTKYKVRKDVDISIYDEDGTMIVAPDDYILKLAPEDMIVQESTIGHIGWKLVLSADRKIINRKVRQILVFMFLLFVLMFVVIYLTVRITVRHVAKPFVRKQILVEQEKAVMDNEMMLAAGAQNELLPHSFPQSPEHRGIDISACLHPARKVGGDLYDYFILGEQLYFCIGDVSGKGVQASLFMAATHYLFRSLAAEKSLSDAAKQMNVSLCTDNVRCRFVTLWMGRLNLTDGELEYVNAGHDAPVLVRNGKRENFPASENMPLGTLEEEAYVSVRFTLIPGDILLLYTDGVTEAMDADGHEFGKEPMVQAAESASDGSASDVVGKVLESVSRHTSGAAQSDDITMLCVKFIETESLS